MRYVDKQDNNAAMTIESDGRDVLFTIEDYSFGDTMELMLSADDVKRLRKDLDILIGEIENE